MVLPKDLLAHMEQIEKLSGVRVEEQYRLAQQFLWKQPGAPTPETIFRGTLNRYALYIPPPEENAAPPTGPFPEKELSPL